MRFIRRSLVGLFLLAVTVGLFAYAGNSVRLALDARMSEESQSRPARERVFAANVLTFQPETIQPVLTTFGEVRARRSLQIRASSGGEVVWLSDAFEEGGAVTAGELLLRIDPAEAQSALDTARADMTEAQADLRDAERTLALTQDEIRAAEDQARLQANALTRQQDLMTRGVGSQAAVENAELALSSANQAVLSRRQAAATAEARIDQARTALQRREIALSEAERFLADTEIFAEFSGVLSDVSIVQGGLINANETLAELIDPTALEVLFRLSTPQYARFVSDSGRLVGAEVMASIDVLGINLEAEGQISRESAAVAEGQTGRLLFARLEDAPGFRPGDFVTVRIAEPPLERVARVPASAVDASGTVLVVGDEDRLEVAAVEVLRREADDVLVRGRELTGREIVAERSPLLGAGIRIRPVRPGAAEAPSVDDLVALDPERRARLVTFVEGNQNMADEAKARVLAQLKEDRVPVRMVERIESRMN
ncbi:MAG: HlyD family efflux transporter periplasmic adaptor subunit [Pseudomonadota bacterium]